MLTTAPQPYKTNNQNIIFKYLHHKKIFDLKTKGESIDKNTEITIKCYKCSNEYPMTMMRMDSNGKSLVCRNCLERKSVQKHELAKPQQAQKQEEPALKEYFCKECKYNFKRANHLKITTCPYCSSSGSLMVKGSTARIIADAAKMKGD
ncbi:hypothetical protein HYX02_07340 [Candidatus Woesearchaeota archaeon]|nr:hypothetical protein [Candidatus Woesearchaeota archaeon]